MFLYMQQLMQTMTISARYQIIQTYQPQDISYFMWVTYYSRSSTSCYYITKFIRGQKSRFYMNMTINKLRTDIHSLSITQIFSIITMTKSYKDSIGNCYVSLLYISRKYIFIILVFLIIRSTFSSPLAKLIFLSKSAS